MSSADEVLWPGALPGGALDLIGLGESSVDTVCVTDAEPAFGDKQALYSISMQPGGTVATAVLACARLGLSTGLLGSVGDDGAAELALAPLRDAGVDLSGVQMVAGATTRRAVVLVSHGSGERAVLGYRDPRLGLAPGDLDGNSIRRARSLLLDASDPDLSTWAAGIARQQGIPVVLDADQAWPRPERLLGLVDFPVVSRRLAEEFGGTGSVRDGLRFLLGHGSRLAVATLGELGALATSGERTFQSPGFRVKVEDLTGAGDGFHGGFIWALSAGLSVARALRVANAVGALNCQALGAQGGLPTQTELQSFLHDRSPEPWRDPDAQEGR
jgi:sulfofructose kinase